MMKTYLFTSTEFEGEIVFKFNDENILLQYDTTTARLNDKQLFWITNRLPKTLSKLKEVLKPLKSAKLTEQKVTGATFEQFWYTSPQPSPHGEGAPRLRARWPSNSSKKKTLKRWNQLPQRERDKACNYFETYLRQIPDGVPMMYAETYLNKELWNN